MHYTGKWPPALSWSLTRKDCSGSNSCSDWLLSKHEVFWWNSRSCCRTIPPALCLQSLERRNSVICHVLARLGPNCLLSGDAELKARRRESVYSTETWSALVLPGWRFLVKTKLESSSRSCSWAACVLLLWCSCQLKDKSLELFHIIFIILHLYSHSVLNFY